MAKDRYYFSHDYNARSDRKMVNLLMNLGIEAIGIYWCIVEMLYEDDGYIMLSECERIAFELRTQCEKIKKVINTELFNKDNDKFWSESVLVRLKIRKDKSETAKESALSRWNNANAMRSHSDSNAIKERKGKERKIIGVSFNEEKNAVKLNDGTTQRLGESQLRRICFDDIKPEEIFKGYIV